MPATEVSPALRRRLSDDARRLLQWGLGHASNASNLRELSQAQRFQNFRAQVNLGLPESGTTLQFRIAASETQYLLRCQFEISGSEIALLRSASNSTSWITTDEGRHVQLRSYLKQGLASDEDIHQIKTIVEIMGVLDLSDVYKACLIATEVPREAVDDLSASDRADNVQVFSATSEKNAYIFTFDREHGHPRTVTQTTLAEAETETPMVLKLRISDYAKFEGCIEAPPGMKSDIELMIDAAMTKFSGWSYGAQQRIMALFDTIDKDGDGYVSTDDVYEQLVTAGRSERHSSRLAHETDRLLGDAADPSDELHFYRFCGFWLSMLVDSSSSKDLSNEIDMINTLESLFLGV